MSPGTFNQMAQAAPLVLQASAALGAGTITTTGVDMLDYEGVVQVVQSLGTITGSVATNKLQHSDTQGGAYTDIDVGAQVFGTAQNVASAIAFNVSEVKRWIRYTVVVTTGPAQTSVVLSGFKKYR